MASVQNKGGTSKKPRHRGAAMKRGDSPLPRGGAKQAKRAKQRSADAQMRLLHGVVERAKIERIALTAGVLNEFVASHVTELETAMQEILRNPDSAIPLRRLAYVTRELKCYVGMVERDQGGAS